MIGNINSLRDVREEKEDNIKIKVVGVGGGGNNAVLHMLHERVINVEMYFINTEIVPGEKCPAGGRGRPLLPQRGAACGRPRTGR